MATYATLPLMTPTCLTFFGGKRITVKEECRENLDTPSKEADLTFER